MEQVTIKNSSLELTVLSYGAVIQKLLVPDGEGGTFNVVVGLDRPEAYIKDEISLGSTVGRYAGRISGGGFKLQGTFYDLYHEDGVHLHGGRRGFSWKSWKIDKDNVEGNPSVRLRYTSPHLEEGYPGELQVTIYYTLNKNTLQIIHEAITDRPTVVNLTNHSYFQLDNSGSIDHYFLKLGCSKYLETDSQMLPTGRILDVTGHEFDFRRGKKMGRLRLDTPFVCDKEADLVAEVHSEHSGIRMRVESNQPALVVYTPRDFPAICFETQNYPDAPNQEDFPSAVLLPGQRYRNISNYEFDLVN